jgi:iron complex transport system substrate-binding protein
MKFSRVLAIVLAISLTALVGCQSTPTVEPNPAPEEPRLVLIEGDGTEVVLDEMPERLVVLSVNTAGILAALGVMPVGIANTARAPEALKDVPQVGIPMSPDIEQIIGLRPDLVISSSTFKATQKSMFEQNNIKAYFIDNQRYTDVVANIEMFGELFNKEAEAQALIDGIKVREQALLHSLANKNKVQPTVMVIFGTAASFMLSSQYSYVGEMVAILGGKNVTESMTVPGNAAHLPFSLENVVALNPDVILRISHGNPMETKAMFEREFASNPLWSHISAVQNDRVYDLSQALFFSNPGLTAIDALEELAQILYP